MHTKGPERLCIQVAITGNIAVMQHTQRTPVRLFELCEPALCIVIHESHPCSIRYPHF